MTQYRLVASDLDGTLFDESVQVSPQNLQAISDLTARGVLFVPCTGRSWTEMPPVLREHADIRYYIYSNGTVVYDKLTDTRTAYELERAQLSALFDTLRTYEAHVTVRARDGLYHDAALANAEAYAYYNLCLPHIGVLTQHGTACADFRALCDTVEHVEVVSVFFHNESEWRTCQRLLGTVEGIRAVESSYCNLEIFHAQAGKGNALCRLCEMLSIPTDQTLGMGDSGNDLPLLQATELALAVGNACPELKDAAHEVICSVHEHALAYVVENYFAQ